MESNVLFWHTSLHSCWNRLKRLRKLDAPDHIIECERKMLSDRYHLYWEARRFAKDKSTA